MRNGIPNGGEQLPVTATPVVSADLERRRFLLTLGAGGVSAAAVAIAAVPGSAASIEAGAGAPAEASGYRETDHVRDYYRTARI